MTNQTISEAYADGKTSGRACNMFIEGDKIYSYGYHYTIARKWAEGFYILNSNRYSSSTARQVAEVRGALERAGHYVLEGVQENRELNPNMAYLVKQRDELADKAKRARTEHMREAYNTQIWYYNNQISHVQHYEAVNSL
jgi:hypothetical protein